MIKTIFIFAVAFFITLFTMWKVEAIPPIPELNKLTRPPQVIKYQQKPYAVFDYGGLQFLFVASKTPTAFPTCNAVQPIGKELMVVTSDPINGVGNPSQFTETCEELEYLYDGLQLHFGKQRLGKKNGS